MGMKVQGRKPGIEPAEYRQLIKLLPASIRRVQVIHVEDETALDWIEKVGDPYRRLISFRCFALRRYNCRVKSRPIIDWTALLTLWHVDLHRA